MRESPTANDVRRKVAEAGSNAWFRPMRILNDEFRYFGTYQHTSAGTLGAMLDLHARGFLVDDGHDYSIDLIADNGDLHDTLPLSREGMRFLRNKWAIRIQPPLKYPTTPTRGVSDA